MLNLMGKRYLYFLFSLLLIIPGLVSLVLWKLPLSSEFTGGSLLQLQFASGKAPPPAQVVQDYQNLGITDAQVATSGADTLIIRSGVIPQSRVAQITDTLSKQFNDSLTVQRFDSTGPSVAQDVTQRGILVVVVSSVILTMYITLVFRGVPNAFRYGLCTVAALVHDVLLMLSLAAITGHFLGWEVDTLFLTAMLTVIAFSAQDTIVVFDRIRENSSLFKRLSFERIVNHSVVQTLTRSINTQVLVVDFLLLAMVLFGGITLRKFSIYLLVGMISGSYSSDFIAAPLLIIWQNKEWRNWFHRGHQPTTPTQTV